jgi:hypothetical protein
MLRRYLKDSAGQETSCLEKAALPALEARSLRRLMASVVDGDRANSRQLQADI